MKNGVDCIREERERQMAKHKYTPGHDTMYTDGELLRAAVAYIQQALYSGLKPFGDVWPFSKESFNDEGYKRSLEKAGALIAAEIDRINLS